MFASLRTAAPIGMTAPITVEVDVGRGLPSCTILGLSDPAMLTLRDRVRAAFGNSGLDWPDQRITICLPPTDLPKPGSGYDLPIAIGLLAAAGYVPPTALDGLWAAGELGLDGAVRPIRGVLAVAQAARAAGARQLVVPTANVQEAALVPDLMVGGASRLAQISAWLRGQASLDRPHPARRAQPTRPSHDLAEVRGQHLARRALEVAAAGGHHLLLIGPPGSGKTMLARRLPGILPQLDQDEALEVMLVHSAAGMLPAEALLVADRPFRAPHHTISVAALIGGVAMTRPGEVSLAHRGVLFLDDLPAFSRVALDALHQPLEDGSVTVTRPASAMASRFPAAFLLLATANPCPCGYAGDPVRACRCGPVERRSYQRKLEGPLLERIDIVAPVEQVAAAQLSSSAPVEPSAAVAARVLAARARQAARGQLNARLSDHDLLVRCDADAGARRGLAVATERLGLTARAHHRVLRLARTVADLAGEDRVTADHVDEALALRTGARPGRHALRR